MVTLTPLTTLATRGRRTLLAAACASALANLSWAQSTTPATAPRTKVMIGMSGWTGLAP